MTGGASVLDNIPVNIFGGNMCMKQVPANMRLKIDFNYNYCSQYIIRLPPVTYTWNLGTMSYTTCQYYNTRHQVKMRCE